MAHVAGTGGSVTFSNFDTGVQAWTLDIVGEALETTDFNDSNRTYIAGLTGWSGSFNVRGDSGNTGTVASTGTITLQISSGKTYSGAVIITGKSESLAVDGIHETTVTFQGTATLTYPS